MTNLTLQELVSADEVLMRFCFLLIFVLQSKDLGVLVQLLLHCVPAFGPRVC